MTEAERFEHAGLIVRLIYDTMPENPRTEYDNVGTMVCFHRRYELGDKHEFADGDAVMEHIRRTKAVSLPLFLYDHSGITMRCSPFACPWDSGQVGVIFVEPAKLKAERIASDKAEDVLRSEVETYDQFLTGDVYGFIIETKTGDELDSCWGYFGIEWAREAAREAAEGQAECKWPLLASAELLPHQGAQAHGNQ